MATAAVSKDYEPYPEAELKAALAFPEVQRKMAIPVVYRLTAICMVPSFHQEDASEANVTLQSRRKNREDKQLS